MMLVEERSSSSLYPENDDQPYISNNSTAAEDEPTSDCSDKRNKRYQQHSQRHENSNKSLLGQALEVPSLTIPNIMSGKKTPAVSSDDNTPTITSSSDRTTITSSAKMTKRQRHFLPVPPTNLKTLPSDANASQRGSSFSGRRIIPYHDDISDSNLGLVSSEDSFIPTHSDYTVPTSNIAPLNEGDEFDDDGNDDGEEDALLLPSRHGALHLLGRNNNDDNNRIDNNNNKRSILGPRVQKKYSNFYQYANNKRQAQKSDSDNNDYEERDTTIIGIEKGMFMTKNDTEMSEDNENVPNLLGCTLPLTLSPDSSKNNNNTGNNGYCSNNSNIPISPLTPADIHNTTHNSKNTDIATNHLYNDIRRNLSSSSNIFQSSSSSAQQQRLATVTTMSKAHEHVYAQSLFLGIAFMLIWSPSNCMAPNLTEMADEFDFNEVERDVYLGANIAFATGVLSLPISAGIGVLADIINRKYLFVGTVLVGAMSSYATGLSPTYKCLFFARLINGGAMSGSVPVAFSLLGDLFTTEERNAASSGLTAMMGVGIIAGQVYAGVVGSSEGWPHAFYVSAILTFLSALLVVVFVKEPIRGGKEEVLQSMIKNGAKYERSLSWGKFWYAMTRNVSNTILMWQGFFSSVPWGIIFVFLNDYLSQERGFSVPDATYLVFVFGIGCAVGGIVGGLAGGHISTKWGSSYLPLFMAVTTFLGIFPFLGLLNGHFTNAHGVLTIFYSLSGGAIASLPSVNVRPCLINVNPPETRGATLTAANLIINVARGIGPSCITVMTALWGVSRQFSFNITLIAFWALSSVQLVYLSRSLPKDQKAMETELAEYAASAIANRNGGNTSGDDVKNLKAPTSSNSKKTTTTLPYGLGVPVLAAEDDTSTIVSIEDRLTSFDASAARQTVSFLRHGFREIGDELLYSRPLGGYCSDAHISEEGSSNSSDSAADDFLSDEAGGVRQNTRQGQRVSWQEDDIEDRQPSSNQIESDDNYPSEKTRLL